MLSEISGTGRKFGIIVLPLFQLNEACPKGRFVRKVTIPEPSAKNFPSVRVCTGGVLRMDWVYSGYWTAEFPGSTEGWAS